MASDCTSPPTARYCRHCIGNRCNACDDFDACVGSHVIYPATLEPIPNTPEIPGGLSKRATDMRDPYSYLDGAAWPPASPDQVPSEDAYAHIDLMGAPGHTDLMAPPEEIDAWLAAQPDFAPSYNHLSRPFVGRDELEDMDTPEFDVVFRPAHYARYTIEPATFIAANRLPFDVGNVVKYVLRFDAKGGAEDVRKARRYCDMILERLDREKRVAAGESAQDVWQECL